MSWAFCNFQFFLNIIYKKNIAKYKPLTDVRSLNCFQVVIIKVCTVNICVYIVAVNEVNNKKNLWERYTIINKL